MKHGRKPISRILSMILAIVMVMSMLPATAWAADGTTLYLVPNANWTQAGARFAMYCFGNGEIWVDMSDPDGDGMYEGTVPAGYQNVIFCRMNPGTTANDWSNKWNQTADLVLPTDGTNCYTVAEGTWDQGGGTWSTVTPEPEPEPDPVTYTVYCINSANWDAVAAYAWIKNGVGTTWPGVAMTKTDETVNGFDVYSATFDVAYENVIFNNNGSGRQTDDLVFSNGQYYDVKSGAWYESLEKVPVIDPLTTDVYLVGSFNSWSTTANEFKLDAEESQTGYVSLELEAETAYEFKVVQDGTWTSCATTITDTVANLVFSPSVSKNVTITTTIAGTYVFAFDVSGSTLSVTYPKAEEPDPETPTDPEPEVPEATYIIAGTAGLCGTEWDIANTANQMTLNGEGLYEKTYESVAAGTHAFKVTDGTWDKTWPGSNYEFTLEAISDVTISFDAASGTVTHTAAPVVVEPEEPETVTVYFQNNWLWTDVSIYCWDSDSIAVGAAWPGDRMTFVENDGAYDIYSAELPANVVGFIINGIKNDGSDSLDKTPDITDFSDGICYSMKWNEGNAVIQFDYTPGGSGPEEPVNNVTIHYRNTGMWSAVNYFYWLENGDNDTGTMTWPGEALNENADHPNWYTLKLTKLNAPNGIGVIFNNGSGSQTADILITENGEYWYDGALLNEAPETWADGSVAMVKYQATLHFADAKNWGTVYLYTWTDKGNPTGAWPGTALAQGEDGFYSMTLEFTAPEGQGLNFIFNNGGDSGKTVDLKLEGSDFAKDENGVYTAEKWVVATTDSEGKFNADIVNAAAAIAISPKVDGNTVTFQYKGATTDTVVLYGTMNAWASGYTMTCNEYGVFSVTLNDVPYGIHEYKFVVNDQTPWITDPLNNWLSEAGNSAFLISDPSKDENIVKINVHFDAPSAEWNVCAWGAKDLEPQYNFVDGVTTITLDGRANQYVAFKVRKSIEGNDWAEQSGEIRVDLSNTVSGTIDIYVNKELQQTAMSLNADIVYANKVKSVELDYDSNTIVIQTVKAVSDAESAFALYKDGTLAEIVKEVTVAGATCTLTLTEELDLVNLYRYKIAFLEDINEAYRGGIHVIGTNTVYASDKFAAEFTYDGELGVNMTKDETRFRLWAPTAEAVTLNLYIYGSAAEDEKSGQDEQHLTWTHEMKPIEKGVWEFVLDFDITHLMYYYTYDVTVNGKTEIDVVDPYARSAGVNGERGAFFDMSSTDPAGWDADKNPNPITSYTDAVIYELHVRDFSIDESSGVSKANRGKYLAFTEKGTTTAEGAVTGIDYLQDLGVTHLHLLPVYDYGSVDETTCSNFNWGYDPVNYNVPEGSYSTNPYDATVRVKEFKQMVMALHDADISVIMDVVYNHVYDAGKFCMNRIVPNYFSRVNADGSFSNGSGCGNDTASEREMVRKFIVESVLYWCEEYHIDGFRFDLVGLLDATTINQIVEEVHKVRPDVIFYGEGWTMGTAVEPGNTMATQANSAATPEFAYFSDTIRNLLAGSNGSSLGFVSGLTGQEEAIANNFMASPWWSSNPQQIVQYASCHDNYTLIDKLILSTGKDDIDGEIIKMNNLAAAIYMTSQGIPFIHAGEEFLREKLEEDGDRCENSYNASDFVNHIEWSNLDNETYAANSDYYKGLIAFRKAHEALRMETRDQIDEYVDYTWVNNEVVMFTIDAKAAGDISDSILVIFNATKNAAKVTLPEGDWSICINGTQAGTEVIGTATGSVSVAGISAMVLVQGETEPETEISIEDKGASLILEGMIHIKQYWGIHGLTAEEIQKAKAYMTVTMENGTVYTVDLVYSSLHNGTEECSAKTDGIPAKNMIDNFVLQAFIEIDGVTYSSESKTYSVTQYCEGRFQYSEDEKLKSALVALMNYGAAAQTYFGYKTDKLLNAQLETYVDTYGLNGDYLDMGWTDDYLTAVTAPSGKMAANFASTGTLKDNGKSLYLKGAISVNYYFGIGDDNSNFQNSTATMYFWTAEDYAALEATDTALTKENASYTVQTSKLEYSGSYGYEYAFQSGQIAAKNLGDALYGAMCVTDSDGTEHCTGIVVYSPEVYARTKLNDGKTAPIDDLCQWMVVYGERAKIYFA